MSSPHASNVLGADTPRGGFRRASPATRPHDIWWDSSPVARPLCSPSSRGSVVDQGTVIYTAGKVTVRAEWYGVTWKRSVCRRLKKCHSMITVSPSASCTLQVLVAYTPEVRRDLYGKCEQSHPHPHPVGLGEP